MQVGLNVKCMHTNFDGRGLIKNFNRSESAQKNHASKD